jgi:hypothetical protein
MSEPSKEAMEKAIFIADSLPPATINSLLVGGYETRDTLINILALEFTNYQKRIEKLERAEWLLHQMFNDLPTNRNWLNPDIEREIKSHLAKGVKEG